MTPTEQKWVERVRAWRGSGLGAREFSIGSGFTGGGLRSWAHVLEKRGLIAPRPGAAGVRSTDGGAVVEKRRPTVPKACPRRVRVARVERSVTGIGSGMLTLEVSGARLSVPAGFEEATLGAVLRALREAGGA